MRPATHLVLPALALCLAACATTGKSAPARFYDGFGGYHRAVATDSPEAQRWFDQGLQLVYGFNHDEGIRSFREATRLDPECAMAWWALAYANGIDINDQSMSEEAKREAYEAAQRAVREARDEGPLEQALARAVAARYAWPAPEERAQLDQAYADAMEEAWGAHPDDPDVGALYAESLMNLQPWDLWTKEGEPKGRTLEIVAVLERVLELRPDHPGANHFYIHTVEASPDPDRAEAAADRLVHLVPGSGHLVHMPSHIYVRVGRWSDAADVNERAIEADRAYFALAPPAGFYHVYYLHNVHMLAYAAMMEGRYETSIEAARRIDQDVPREVVREHVSYMDGLMATPLHVLVRFGRWEEVLEESEAPDFRLLSRATRRYARGVALAALGRTGEARQELARFEELAPQVPEDWKVGNNDAQDVLGLMLAMLQGEILYREGRHDEAFARLREAALAEDALVYDEPPGWMHPVRHALGALLLGAGRAEEAERVYREDLERNRGNGWSLLGLEQALRAQGELDEVAGLAQARAAAWERADVQPASSCYCEPGAGGV